MLKNHPKGLIPAALSNMGERFGFYVMMAILTLFLMSKFDLDGTEAGALYSTFYCSIYILALIGGIIADKTRNYKGTIIAGLLVMALGYALMSLPDILYVHQHRRLHSPVHRHLGTQHIRKDAGLRI